MSVLLFDKQKYKHSSHQHVFFALLVNLEEL